MNAHDGVSFAPYRDDEPDRLPGESRTVPGYAEEQSRKRERQASAKQSNAVSTKESSV